MIKSKNNNITLKGTIPCIMTDLAVLTRGIKELIEKECGEFGIAIAHKLITDAVEAGFMTDDEIRDSIKDIRGKRKKLESEMERKRRKSQTCLCQSSRTRRYEHSFWQR